MSLFVFPTTVTGASRIVVLLALMRPATSAPTITTVYLEVWLAITANQPAWFQDPPTTTTVPMEVATSAI